MCLQCLIIFFFITTFSFSVFLVCVYITNILSNPPIYKIPPIHPSHICHLTPNTPKFPTKTPIHCKPLQCSMQTCSKKPHLFGAWLFSILFDYFELHFHNSLCNFSNLYQINSFVQFRYIYRSFFIDGFCDD